LAVAGEQGFDLIATERELFDIDHCQAGAWAHGENALPAGIVEVVSKHTIRQRPFRMVHLVRIAGRVGRRVGLRRAPGSPLSALR